MLICGLRGRNADLWLVSLGSHRDHDEDATLSRGYSWASLGPIPALSAAVGAIGPRPSPSAGRTASRAAAAARRPPATPATAAAARCSDTADTTALCQVSGLVSVTEAGLNRTRIAATARALRQRAYFEW